MKQLTPLLPVLKHFTVRVDENGKIVNRYEKNKTKILE